MTGTTGYSTEMAIVKEGTPGTVPAVSGAQREYFTEDPGINPVQSVVKLPTVSARYERKPVLSNYHVEGSIPIIATAEGALGILLTSALGEDTSALVNGTAYSHTFAPADAPSTLAIWMKYGTIFQRTVNYCVVNTLEFTQSPDDALRVTASFIGQKDIINADDMSTAAAYDTLDPFMNSDLTVTGPANATQVHNSTITLNNNYDVADGRVHGSRFFGEMIPGKREITGSFDMWFDSPNDYKSFWGATDATEPDENGDFSTIELAFNWNMNNNFSTTYDHELTINIPDAVYETTNITIGNRVKQTVTWSASYGTAEGYEMNIVLQNTKDTDY